MTTKLHSFDVVEVELDVGSISSNSSQTVAVTVPGVLVGDFVIATKPSLTEGVIVGSALVSDDDTVHFQIVNATAGSVDPGSELYAFLIYRPYGNKAAFGS